VDVSLLIRHRLRELNLDQKALAAAAEVTESYISQLLTRKKAPPAPGRTDIYERIGEFLSLPGGELAKLAEAQRIEELRRRVTETPTPLFGDFRELLLRKCRRNGREEVRRIFEKEPFGVLERIATRTILGVAQGVAREELREGRWLRSLSRASGQSYEETRVAVLEFLDTDVFQVSAESCVSFLDPMIDSWKIDLKAFDMEIALNSRLAPGSVRRFAFVEKKTEQPSPVEPAFLQFLEDRSLSGGATDEEIELLKSLRFPHRRPTPLYYYRELQSLRDPLHFSALTTPGEST